ncbi:hypothetical protein, partial [Paraburkholderia humisilvae]|uniref:hypothetical protein n=1 Tax=Paraburkholderia humisilvae TaxID=627669 RepID=UPI001C2ECFC5
MAQVEMLIALTFSTLLALGTYLKDTDFMPVVPDPDAQNSRPNAKRDWAACLSAQGERDKIHALGMGRRAMRDASRFMAG